MTSHAAHRHRPLAAPLAPRSREEPHRTATPLELFFDLVIVVAVAQAAAALHHSLAEGHFAHGVLSYAMLFFGVWWAWVNFTWFSSAYDNDDVSYRLLVLLQLTGALVFAAGIPSFAHGDARIGVLGYVLMRLALVTLWIRASHADKERCQGVRRYAFGVLALQVAWVAMVLVRRDLGFVAFWVLAACELLVPAWAERRAPTPWHPEHIAERYGLFTLITLGESILAASVAIRSAGAAGAGAAALWPIIVGGLLIVFSFWWLYFEHPGHEALASRRGPFVWGYGHYFVFGSAAAVGAGLAVAVDQATQRAAISAAAAGAAVAIPAAVFLACLWFLHGRSEGSRLARVSGPAAIVLILLTPFTGQATLGTGLLMAGLVAVKCVRVPG